MSEPPANGSAAQLLEQYRTLLGVSQAIASQRDLHSLLKELAVAMQRVVHFDEAGLDLYNEADGTMRLYIVASAQPTPYPLVTSYPVEQLPTGQVWKTQQPLIIPDLAKETRWPQFVDEMHTRLGAQSFCVLPLTTARRRLGTLGFVSRKLVAYRQDELEFLQQVVNQVAVAVENALAFQQIEEFNRKVEQEKVYLEEEVRKQLNFEEIIGESDVLRRVLSEVETVAPTDSTVLIRGETGTGKELIARAIHHLSSRRDRTFVRVNCAAIPTGLLESELFGHEKGAFTGAVAQKIGRFELAHEGTLFLDEVGDIPPELQPKLLRVLQDREFERLGSTQTIRVNVRLMAATNRDLAAMVADRTFRKDLYYRLHVFPVLLPPLRERRQDIPRLVRHFTQKFARRMGKSIDAIPANAMAALTDYTWPGNIRELENLIERAVILTPGHELHVPVGELAVTTPAAEAGSTTLANAEREHILRVLHDADWVLAGPKGAATRLGMKRSTLQWKMKKLGIAKPS